MNDLDRHARWQEHLDRDLLRVHSGELSPGDFVMLYGWAPKAISIDDVALVVAAIGDDVEPDVLEAVVRIRAAIGFDR